MLSKTQKKPKNVKSYYEISYEFFSNKERNKTFTKKFGVGNFDKLQVYFNKLKNKLFKTNKQFICSCNFVIESNGVCDYHYLDMGAINYR